jgi:hypothetical protein
VRQRGSRSSTGSSAPPSLTRLDPVRPLDAKSANVARPPCGLLFVLSYFAPLLLEDGRLQDEEELFSVPAELDETSDVSDVYLLRIRSALDAARGDFEAAETAARGCVEAARVIGYFVVDVAVALEDLARVLGLAGRAKEAGAAAEEAAAVYRWTWISSPMTASQVELISG